MKRSAIALVVILLMSTISITGIHSPFRMDDPGEVQEASQKMNLANLLTPQSVHPRAFVQNSGQKGEGAGLFYYEGRDFAVSFGIGGVGYYFNDPVDEGPGLVTSYRMVFCGARQVVPVGVGLTASRMNYFIGNEPEKWRTGVQCYEAIRYDDLWSGIDLVYRLVDGRIKYECTVDPFVDPSVIAFRYEGAVTLEVDGSTGSLIVEHNGHRSRELAPDIYQGQGENRCPIVGHYRLMEGNIVSFSIHEYDESAFLIIDPVLDFMIRDLVDTTRKQKRELSVGNNQTQTVEEDLSLDPNVVITRADGEKVAQGVMPFG